MSAPPSPSRYVTGHNAHGRAVILFEGSIPRTEVLETSGKSALFGVPWRTSQFPCDLSSSVDAGVRGGPLHDDGGTLCRVVEFPPQTSSPFHRTISLDYGILVSGEMHLELDEGVQRVLKPGDIVVQRGTMHAWHNKTDEYARMVFVLTAAGELVVNGVKLENAMLRD